MQLKLVSAILIMFFIFSNSFSQIGKWQNYTSMQTVNKIAVTENGIWSATTGGAFFYNFLDKSFTKLTTSEGLKSIKLTAIAVDKYGRVWFGSINGNIDIYNPTSEKWIYLIDIANSSKIKKQINDIVIDNTTAYISSDFGISLIDIENLTFGDTYTKLGSFGTDTKVNSVFKEDSLWVATERGIAVQKYGLSNYLTPTAWNNFNVSSGSTPSYVTSIVRFKDTLYVGTSQGLYFFSNNTFTRQNAFGANVFICDMECKGDSLIIATQENAFVYFDGAFKQIFPQVINKVTDISIYKNSIYFGSSSGIPVLQQTNMSFIYPNSPSTNLFPSMVVDDNGNLWCASGRDVVNKGFYKFDGQIWKNFLLADYPVMGGNAYHKVNFTSGNTVWMNSWGYGFLKLKNGEIQTRFHSGNTPLVGIKDNKDFIVAAGVAEDSKKNLWFAIHDPGNKNLLAKLSDDSVWTFYKNEADTNTILTDDFIIDKYDTKWLTFKITLNNSQEGVYYFNETGNISNRKGFLTTTQGLNGTPTSIAVDLQGEIWIGTNLGVNIITNPTNPSKGIISVYALRNQYINCIKVDGLNNKWVGTQKGVWVLSPDGSQVLVQYNSNNSPILSDDIKSIAIDDNKGLVYFGTEVGLSSLWTTSVKPFEEFNELSVFPNPFYLDGTGKKLTIDGLVRNSLIKIISVDGNLIKDFVTPGGRIAFWDGKNNNGNFVSSGVYFIIAYTENGEKVATSKVAVINK